MATLRITYNDKSHVQPYGTHEIQVWDTDMNELKDVINLNADQTDENTINIISLTSGYQGELLIADTPTSDGYYLAGESGTYTNAGGLVIDLTEGVNYINVSGTQTVFTKTVIPVDTIPTGDVAEGETLAVSGGKIFDITSVKADLVVGKNLFNKDTITAGYYVNWGSPGELVSSAGFSASDYITILPSTEYILNQPQTFLSFYDENKNWISGTSSAGWPLTTPSNAEYIRLTINVDTEDTAQFELGNVSTVYESYSITVPPSQLPTIPNNTLLNGTHLDDGNLESPTLYQWMADDYVFSGSPVVGSMALVTPFTKTKNVFAFLKFNIFNLKESAAEENSNQEIAVSFYADSSGDIFSFTANSIGGDFITELSIVNNGVNWVILFNDILDEKKFRHIVLKEINVSYASTYDVFDYTDFSFINLTSLSGYDAIKSTYIIPNETDFSKNTDRFLTEISGNKQHIKSTIKDFSKKLSDAVDSVKVLFNGDSITNFQNANPQDATIRPLGMYCPDTFTYKTWQLLNPKTYNPDGTVLNEFGNLEFVKVDHATKVNKVGTFIENTTTPSLGNSGGSANGLHEFYYTRTLGNYIEFTIDKDSIGFSVLVDKYIGNRTDGSNNLVASDSVKIYVDGVLEDTVSLVGLYPFENKRLDYTVTPSASPIVIKVENNATNKWMPVWGVEGWVDFCVRPVNCGVSSQNSLSLLNSKEYLIDTHNADLVIWQGNCLNDSNTMNFDIAENNYVSIIEHIQTTLNIPLLVLNTHSCETASITVDPSLDVDFYDYTVLPNYYYSYSDTLKFICDNYGVAYLSIANYFKDIYSLDLDSLNYLDGIHLSVQGHQKYIDLLDIIFKKES